MPVGSATIITSAPGFAPHSESVSLVAGTNTHDVVLTPPSQANGGAGPHCSNPTPSWRSPN